jgi:SNF2 family DNA or RNA helicase
MSSGSVNPAANAAAAAREAAIKREGDWRVGLPPPNAPSRPGLGNYNPHSNYLDLTTTPDYSFTNIFGNMASGVANTVNTAFNAASAMGRSLSDYDAAFQGRMDEVSDYIQDPRRTAQEIQDLLENIRPDTEIPKEDREGTPEGLKYALYEHQKLALTWLKQMEEGTNKGGILADDMGLGKTISALALILSKPSQDRARKTTLIVGPVALVRQWEREVQTKIKPSHSLSTFLYHGGKKKKWSELRTFDIVLTTYGTLGAEYKRWETWKGQCDLNRDLDPNAINSKLPLLGKESNWHRVILDESQCIKNKLTKAASAVFHLKASTRFCLTGTPMMNGVHELYSLIKFLRIRPYNDYKRFNEDFGCLSKSVGRYGYNNKEYAMKRLQAVLKAILLRRTKSSQIDGKPILVLPPKTEEIVHAIFNEDEQAYYSGLEDRTRVQFNKYVKSGTIGKNYSNILVLLLRLRQAACHPHLIMDFEEAPAEATPEDMTNLAKTLTPEVVRRIIAATFPFECPVCYDSVLNPRIVIPCGHDTCSECLAKITGVSEQEAIARGDESGNGQAKCPTCRGKIDSKRLIDYETFKQVHMKDEKDKEVEGVDEDDDGESISDSDLDSDSDSDEDSETESEDEDERPGRNGDLRNFIVPDDEVTESEKEESDEEDDDLNIGTSSTQTKPAKKERKFKREVKDEDETDSDYVGLGSLNRQTRKTRLSGATNVANDDASETMSAKEEDTNDSDLVDIKDFKPLARRSRTASRSLIKAEEADGEDTEDTDIKPPKRSRQDSKLRRPAKKAKSSSAKGKGKDKKSSKKESRRGKKRSRGADDEEKKPEKHLSLAKLKAEAMRSKEGRKRYMRYLKKNWISSAKVDKCLEILRDTDPEVKTIVFSQFTTLLDLLEVPMKQEEWKFCRYDGSMTADQRHKSIMKFTDDPSVRLMIVSLKAGNAGLNLVAASQVIILDPFWNPYIEMQAVDRAHRIGQQKPVKVHRILVAKTVEDRIMELQGQKRKFVDAALDEKASQSLGRLGQRELIYLFNGDGVQGSGRETQARLPVSLGVPGMGAGGSGAAGPSGSMGMGMPPPSLGSGLGNGMGSGASSRGLGGSSVYGP